MLRVADGAVIGCNDVILVAGGTGRGPDLDRTSQWDDHPRVRQANRLRLNVAVYGDEHGFVTISTGLAGRQELSIELAQPGAVAGLGRQYVKQGLRAVAADSLLFAAVSPGNARSLRSFLAAGFTPIGSEVIIDRLPPGPT
jgi:hypothetical protein